MTGSAEGIVHVCFLGPAGELAGVLGCDIDLPVPAGNCIGALRRKLVVMFPALEKGIDSMRFAVNQQYAADDRILCANDEVALIPPVSGGTGAPPRVWVDIVDGKLPEQRARDFARTCGSAGGIVVFEGVTRSEECSAHGPLVALHYEAYVDMAQAQLRRLCDEAVRSYSLERVAMLHRVGRVPVGESSVIIVVGAAHRAESFTATQELINRLKRDVPIWKKDVFSDGHERWVEPTRPAASPVPNP